MVLRFNCPCGAPYALADHLAGQTFRCTQCQRALKIGAPKAAPPPQRDPDALMASMEWSSEQQAPSPQQLRPSGGGQRPPSNPNKLDLAPDPDAGPPPAQPPPGRRSSGSHAVQNVQDRARRRSSRQGRTSGRAKRTSGARKVPSRPAAPARPGAHSRKCPVCDETIAKIAPECPACGVVLKRNHLGEVGQSLAAFIKPVIGLAAVAAIVIFVINTVADDKKPSKSKNKVAVSNNTPKTEDKTEPTKTPVKTGPTKTKTATKTPTKTDDEPIKTRVRAKTDVPPEKTKTGHVGISRGGIVAVIPDGPLKPDFIKLRDAQSPKDVRAAVLALAAKKGAPEAIAKAMAKSDNRRYTLRVHRANLRAGDEERQRQVISKSLQKDAYSFLVYTVLAALELDAQGFRQQLQKISYKPRSATARLLVDTLLENTVPSGALLSTLRADFNDAEPDIKVLLAILLAMMGEGSQIETATRGLTSPIEEVRALTRKTLWRVSAGLGPSKDADPKAWRDWVEDYQPKRELLAKACAEPPFRKPGVEKISKAKQEAIEEGAQILPALAAFSRDLASKPETAGRALGDIIARTATGSHLKELTAILAQVEQGRSEAAAVPIIVGVMLAADNKIAGPVVSALMRTGPPLDHAHAFPDLLEPASNEEVQPLVDYVQALPRKKAGMGWRLVGCFRSESLADIVLVANRGRTRTDLAARLGSKKVEQALLDYAQGKGKVKNIPNADGAKVWLGDIGTSQVMPAVMKLMLARPDYALTLALQKLATPKDITKLKKIVETIDDVNLLRPLMEMCRKAGGEKAIPILAKRYKNKDDAFKPIVGMQLRHLGAKVARPLILKVYTDWQDRKYVGNAPTIWDVKALARCGKPSDGTYLADTLQHRPTARWDYKMECILGLVKLEYKGTKRLVEGYLLGGHKRRDVAGVVLALLGEEGEVDALKASCTAPDAVKLTRHQDCTNVAAMAWLNPEAAQPIALEYLPKVAILDDSVPATSIAFALALANDHKSLAKLATSSVAAIRGATARGIGWAVYARGQGDEDEGITAPDVLDLLRVDPDVLVRAEAAVARAHFGLPGAKKDLGLALEMVPVQHLDVNRVGTSNLIHLAGTTDQRSLRSALWAAHAALDSQALRWREGLGAGRILEAERAMRR